MSLPRLSFLFPSLQFSKRLLLYPTVAAARQHRHRHGTAVEPTPIPPVEEKGAPATAVGESNSVLKAAAAAPEIGKLKLSPLLETGIDTEAVAGDKTPPSSPSPSPSPSFSSPQTPPSPQQVLNLAPGEWVHHFDTYSLAKSLEGSGFKNAQAVTIMKGIRGLLTQNLEVAKENLVSKSNVENESYLFHAACSELRNEIQSTRKAHIDTLRADGAAIQQEYDLLNQKFLEDMMSLKDELNGLFNDRKMVTRAEQREKENMIQELNYRITVLFSSDLRSEIEKLRWTTTRRGLIAIAALAIFVVSSIRMSKARGGSGGGKGKKAKENNEGEDDGDDDTHGLDSRLLPVDTHVEGLVNAGRSFVSLG